MSDPLTSALNTEIEKALNSSEISSQQVHKVSEIINSRTDMPKAAALLLRKKIGFKNSPKQMNALEILDHLMVKCKLNFHNQIASKDFQQTLLSQLQSRELKPEPRGKILYLIETWGKRFEAQKDIVPTFYDTYSLLKSKGVDFPSRGGSRSQATASSGTTVSSNPRPSANRSVGSVMKSSGSFTPENPKFRKLVGDLQIVKDNIVLTNQMIDAADPSDDVNTNEVLKELVQTLKGRETKLMNLIASIEEEDVMNFCLNINDDLHVTLERFNALKRHRKPDPFHASGKIEEPVREEEKETVVIQRKANAPDLLGDMFESPVTTNTTTTTTTNSNPVGGSGLESMMFGPDLSTTTAANTNVTTSAATTNTSATTAASNDPFGWGPDIATTSNTTNAAAATSATTTATTTGNAKQDIFATIMQKVSQDQMKAQHDQQMHRSSAMNMAFGPGMHQGGAMGGNPFMTGAG
eukprot:CAMPEP_0115041390 /NCGR_PEP_ID=MMETSP0216-20121206/45490_1 /TAXON_ID=223996 /ORGANISM="Protocruzia adherens, Strain Boccale" /LENGTH=465 /DNA_ID=CAMNT_0002423001 /DNA_START=54 /DNA_END=1447 /DNA_ORIENTATION=+